MRAGVDAPTVATPAASVSLDGVPYGAVRVSTERALGGGGVPGMSQSAAAEGTVEWAQIPAVLAGPGPSPWDRVDGFPPAPGTAVDVSVGTIEGGLYRALTGVVDTSSADSEGVVESSVIDPVDRLHRRVSIPAMLHIMPPHISGGPLRRVGLSSDFIVDWVLRMCRTYSTPTLRGAGVSVPGQGSVWPVRGTNLTASAYGDVSEPASVQGTEWGYGIVSAAATYSPAGSFTVAGGAEIGAMVSSGHAATARVSIHAGGHRFDLIVTSDGSVQARHDNGATSVSLPAASGWRRVKASFTGSSMTISTDDGRTATGSHSAPASATTATVSTVDVAVAPGGRIGGVVAGICPDYLTQHLDVTMIGWGLLDARLTASPAITSRDALDVIGEIAEATCRAYWWDEEGTFRWVPGDELLSRPPAATLTSTENLLDLGWSESITDTYQRVIVDRDIAAVKLRTTPSTTVWEGRGEAMQSGQISEEIITPPGDEDWIGVDESPLNASGNHDLINRSTRSVVGGIRTDGESWRWGDEGGLLETVMQRISTSAWKFTHSTGELPLGQTMQLAFPDRDAVTTLWQHWRGKGLPIVRAYARVSWAPGEAVAGDGPSTSGDYTHAGGRWLRGFEDATPQQTADFLASWLCVPRYRATGVQVVHDPRIQVGDVVTVRDEHAHGVTLTALITRIAQTTTADDQDMTLDLFIIDGAPVGVTLGQHDAANAGLTLGQHDTSRAGKTLAAHDADPLHLT